MRTTYVTCCIWQVVCLITCSSGDFVVNSRFGSLRGTTGVFNSMFDMEIVSYVRFHGVPYAEPPIGETRFMPPVKRSTRWQGTLDARQPGPICPQSVTEESVIEEDEFMEGMISPTDPSILVTILPPVQNMTEDCLTLDIIVPIVVKQVTFLWELDPLPVMVWFHGGDFLRGSSQDQDGAILAAKTGAIIVNVNYRLGIFGFLSTGVKSLVPGNAGLLDQQLALDWIQENIQDFGGDPGRVTIFGDGAGSESVTLHLFVNNSQPLFHRAIIQNDINFPWNLPNSSTQTVQDLSVKVGCGERQDSSYLENIVECLQSLSFGELLKAAETIPNATWGPVRDDILFKAGETEYVIGSHDVILGITSWSDISTISPFVQSDSLSSGVSENEFNDVISDIATSFTRTNQSDLIVSSIRQIYNNWEEPYNEQVRALSLMRLLNDWDVLNPAFQFLRLWVPQEDDAKVFVFVFDDNSNENAAGQTPVSSLSDFIWGQPFEESDMGSFSRNLSQNIIFYWRYFIEKGDPNRDDLHPYTEWPNFDFMDEMYMDIGANFEPIVMHHYRASFVTFWLDYLPMILSVVNVEEDAPVALIWDLTPSEVAFLFKLFLALIVVLILLAITCLSACCGFRSATKRQELVTQRWMFKAQVYENSHMANVRNDYANGAGFRRLTEMVNHVNVFNIAESDEEGAPSFDSLDLPDYQAHLNTLDESTFL